MKRILQFMVAVTAMLSAAESQAQPAAPKPPNFVVILGEGAGWSSTSAPMDDTLPDSKSDLLRTPNLARLANEGMRFSRFYAASPRCTPSRAAILTGKSPAQLHMTFVNDGRKRNGDAESDAGVKMIEPASLTELPAGEITIGDLLKRAGYTTAHFGKWHVGRASPARHGFDESDGPTGNDGPGRNENPNPEEAFAMTQRGMDFMAKAVTAGKPFYLQLSHYPGRRGEADARPETYAAVRQRASGLDARHVAAAAIIEDMDAAIGALLKKIDDLGIANTTYVLYTTDHGAIGRNANRPLRGGKGTLYEGGIRVPLIVRGPGIKAGSFSHAPATDVDLLPTLAELARITEPLPKGLEGGSLAPLLSDPIRGAVKRTREDLYFHFPHYDQGNDGPVSAVISGDDKLIKIYETGALHLYDLSKDDSEQHDLAKDEPKKVADLDRRLTAYLQAIGAQMPSINSMLDRSRSVRCD